MPHSPPPPSDGELLQLGLHHLVQHNSNTPYPQKQQYDEGVHVQSAYGSPVPMHEDGYTYHSQQSGYVYQHQHQDSGLGIQYDDYNHGQIYQDQYSTPATSPPTPSISSSEMLRTRSGLGFPRAHQSLRPMPEARSQVAKSPKPKRVKPGKPKAEKKIAKLEKPLSELTKDWAHLPIVDIEAYVNRSAEERRKEVEQGKIPGKVKRPMNSFMLYRKAYQGRTKDWCLQNNHQIVSQVCGDSWPLEPDEIKEQYSEWARIERLNHQNAHPGYKFSPSKPGTAKASKRKVSEEPTSEESDLDDFEWQAGSSRKSKKQRSTPRVEQPVEYPSTKSAYVYSRDNSVEPNHGYNMSTYHVNNPGRLLPPQYDQDVLRPGEYYQQTVRNNPSIPGVQDIIIKKALAPGMNSYLGLPGGQEYDMMDPYPRFEASPAPEQRIDSSLMTRGQTKFEKGNYHDPIPQNTFYDVSQNGDQQWQAPYGMSETDSIMPFIDPELNQEGTQIQDPHMHVLKGNQEGWHVESLDSGGEFDKWMDGP